MRQGRAIISVRLLVEAALLVEHSVAEDANFPIRELTERP